MNILLLIFTLIVYTNAQGLVNVTNNENKTSTGLYSCESFNLVTLGQLNKRYLFVDIKASFIEAMFFCNAYGMDLATIKNETVNDLIVKHIQVIGKETSRYFYISAHKISRGQWLWADGSPITYSNWCKEQPNEQNTAFCMAYRTGCWSDIACDYIADSKIYQSGFICEER